MSGASKQHPRYSMVIQWSTEDQAFIVSIPEFPGNLTHGDTYEEAVRQGEDLIESYLVASYCCSLMSALDRPSGGDAMATVLQQYDATPYDWKHKISQTTLYASKPQGSHKRRSLLH